MSSNIDFLFVRHGESYANISPIYKLKQKFLHEPFLTNNGLLQAYLFGTKLKESYSDYDEIMFCSSLMVRSMQTCKLISKGYCDHNKIRLSKEIKRLPFCMEKSSLFDKLYIVSFKGKAILRPWISYISPIWPVLLITTISCS